MAIFRGIGGAGDSTTDATVTTVTEKAVEAAASASAASSSASSAASSASSAATSAASASSSASNASSSASSASSSASAASSAQTASEAAQTAAEAAQSSAETAQTAAEAAQTASETAQTASETAQAAAEAVYDTFDDRYLGDKASDPSVDNDGNALQTGALYFNTTVPEMRVYTGSVWVDFSAGAAVSSFNTRTGAVTLTSTDVTDALTYTPATPAQGALADSALQPGDNISTLTNDSGYVTPSSTATFTNKSGNISQWTNDSGYLTSFTETNDLTAAVTWANVPDANITQSSVTQHQAALSITESQISDLGAYITASSTSTLTNKSGNISQWTNDSGYLTDITGESIKDLSDVYSAMSPTDGQLLTWDNANTRWAAQDAPVSLPSQTGNAGYLLTTDGTTASWTNTVNGGTY